MKQNLPNVKNLHFAVLATDVALMTVKDGSLRIRLVPVNRPPHFPLMYGLPGGLIHPTETAEESALRLIHEKARITSTTIYLEQLYTFSEVNRDPRGRVVAVAYIALIPWESLSEEEQADTDDASWVTLTRAHDLAYDHDLITTTAVTRLRSRAHYTTILGKLMPSEFTLTDLERVYESILHTGLDKRNFRKKILNLGVLTPLNRKRSGGAFRPAQLYRFTSSKVTEIEIL